MSTGHRPVVGNVVSQARADKIALPLALIGGWSHDSPRRVRLRRAHARETPEHMPSQAAVDREKIEDGAAQTHLAAVWIAVVIAALVAPWVAVALSPWLVLVSARRAAARRAPMTMRQAVRSWRPAAVPVGVAGLLAVVWHGVPGVRELPWAEVPLDSQIVAWVQPAVPGLLASAALLAVLGVAVVLGGRVVRDHAAREAEFDDARALVAAAVGVADPSPIEVVRTARGLSLDLRAVRTSMQTALTAAGVEERLTVADSEWAVEEVAGLEVHLRPVTDADRAARTAGQQTEGLLGGGVETAADTDFGWDGWRNAA